MSYKIHIEADTIVELGGKLLALAAQFQPPSAAAVSDPVMKEVKETAKKSPTKVTAVPATEEATSSTATSGAASASVAQEEKSSDAGEQATTTVITDDVLRDLVIGLVKAKGREVMPPLLAQFGVAKATEVTDPAVRIELANALRDAVGE